MGGQLTKEQENLPFGYVSKAAHRKSRITGITPSTVATIRPNVHFTPDSPDLFFDVFAQPNTPNTTHSITIPRNAGETASIATAATADVISPELSVEEVDKSEEDMYAGHHHSHGDEDECCKHGGFCEELGGRQSVVGLNPILFSHLPSLADIGLCQLGLVKLSANICFLFATTKLQICCNELTSIPPEIGYMKNLVELDVSSNRLQSIPDTIGFLHKLTQLKLSQNQLTSIPSSIGSLKKLETLTIDSNRITELPPEIGQIKRLVNLDVCDNPITVLPAEIGRLQYLRKLRIDRCPLQTEFVHELVHSPPSLMELAARTIVRQQIPILQDTTQDIKDYLASAKKCSFCGGPYFETYVKRGKIIEKNDHQIPLEYRLCCPHWNTEQERVSLLFCPLPDTAPSPVPYRHSLQTGTTDDPALSIMTTSSDLDIDDTVSEMKMQRRTSRSLTIPLSSLTRAPSLPSLPRSATTQTAANGRSSQGEKELKKSTGTKRSLSLWRSRKNSAASVILGKPVTRSGSSPSRLNSRLRL